MASWPRRLLSLRNYACNLDTADAWAHAVGPKILLFWELNRNSQAGSLHLEVPRTSQFHDTCDRTTHFIAIGELWSRVIKNQQNSYRNLFRNKCLPSIMTAVPHDNLNTDLLSLQCYKFKKKLPVCMLQDVPGKTDPIHWTCIPRQSSKCCYRIPLNSENNRSTFKGHRLKLCIRFTIRCNIIKH